MKPEFFSRPKGKASFDELYCPLNRGVVIYREQKMEMIGHHDEFVQPKFSLGAIVVQNANK
jgi:hypothetical protein